MTSSYFWHRFDAYRHSLEVLRMNGTLLSERKAAIAIRDEFEIDLREGKFDKLLRHMFAYSNMVSIDE